MTEDGPPSKFPMCDFERICYEVRPCDVLLIEGRSRISEIIKSVTQSSWSHSALYIGKLNEIEDKKLRSFAKEYFSGDENIPLVIEGILGKGTVLSPLSDYINDHIRICRPRGITPQDSQKVLAFCIKKLGSKYNVRQIFDLFRLLLPWSIMPRKFRSKLFSRTIDDSNQTICSTMIAEAFISVEFPVLPHISRNKDNGIELIPRNPKLFTPRDFDYSPFFDIIKYPFIELNSHAVYRKLPWNKDLISHDNFIEEYKYEISDSKEENTIESKIKPE